MKPAISIAAVLLVSYVGYLYFFTDANAEPTESEVQEKLAEEIAEKRKQIADQFEKDAPSMTAEQIQKTAEEIRDKSEQLSEDKRQEMRNAGREMFREKMQQAVDEYYAAPEEERVAVLDRHIDQMEKLRKMFSAMRPKRTEGGSGGGPGGGGPGGGPGGGRPGGGGASGVIDHKQMNQRRAAMLSNTTPEQRAYFSALMERREERDLPSFGRGGR